MHFVWSVILPVLACPLGARFLFEIYCTGDMYRLDLCVRVCVSKTQRLFTVKFSIQNWSCTTKLLYAVLLVTWGSVRANAFQTAWEVRRTCSKNKVIGVIIKITIVSSGTIWCTNKINFLYSQNYVFLPSLPLKALLFHLHLLRGYIRSDQSLNLRTNRRSVVKADIEPRGIKLDEPNIIWHYYLKKNLNFPHRLNTIKI